MSSGITATDHMMSGNNITPWHGLGTIIPGLATAKQAISLAKLEWTAEMEDIVGADTKDSIGGYKRVYRSDTKQTFGIVGSDYTPIQNARLAELVEPLVSHSDRLATFETAGSIFGGETVFFLLNLQDFKLDNGEAHKSYLAMVMGHGGKRSITALLTNTRLCCRNTINIALGEGDKLFKKKHTKNVEQNVIDELAIIAAANNRSEEFRVVANKLLNVAMTMDEANKLTKSLLGKESTASNNVKDEILALFKNGKGNNGKTAWDWINGVTEYVDHNSRTRVVDGKNREEVKAYSTIFGSGGKMKDKALELVEVFAGI